ncbi:MAG: hypothetical protein ACI9U2_000673 [Bradymonadia bacterium]|jgi:hypothetical protein
MQQLEADDVVEIRQRSEGREPLVGWIAAASAARLLIETIVDGAFHGWRILPTHDITHADRTGWTRLATRMLRGTRRPPPLKVPAVLGGSWRTLLTTLEDEFGVISITRSPEVDDLYVGRVLRWLDDGLWILTIDADGTIDPEPFEVSFDTITCVEFASPYTAMYAGAVDWDAVLLAARAP